MIPVSRQVRDVSAELVGDRVFLSGIRKDLEMAKAVEHGMETVFGAAVLQALEEMERNGYAKMREVSPMRVFTQMEARAEIAVAQYVKSRLLSRLVNIEALENNLKELAHD